MSDNITNNPHDKYFREVFSKKPNIKDLLYNSLPEKIFNEIDFNNFVYSNKSYIDEDLRDVESDLVVKTIIGKQDCYFYILFEHKSYSDKYAFFQLLKYMMKIWESEVKENKRYFTPIIPVLFNQSKHKWSHGDAFSMYFNEPNGLLGEYLPYFKYRVYDLNTLSDNEIIGNIWFVTSIKIMKYIRDLQPYLEEIYNYILANINRLKDYPDELKTFIIYLLNASNKKDEEYIENTLKNTTEGLYMSLAKKYVEEGRKEEKIETARKMKKEGFDIKLISKLTGLSEEEIQKL